MGSHSARSRPARRRADRPEERATVLLARLGAAPTSGPGPNRHAARAAAGPLDPFGTAPVPSRPARPAELTGTGATRCSGSRTILRPAVNPVGVPLAASRHAADDRPAPLPSPRRAETGSTAADPADISPWCVPAAFATGDGPPPAGTDDAPAGLAPDDVPDAPARGRIRRAQPVIAALSVTAVGASAVLAGTGFAENADPAPAGATTTLGAAPAGALNFALPSSDPATPPTTVAGPTSVLTPEQKPVQVSDIVAKAVADAHAVAAKQAAARKAATDKAATDRAAAAKAAAARHSAPAPVPTHTPGGGSSAGAGSAAASTGSSVGVRALAAARTKLGKPYVWGAAGPNSFDCSGLVMWAFKQVGVSLPHSSASQSTMGTAVSKANLQPGDLVFFYSPVSHVGIYVGNGQVLNATQSGEPVQITNLAYMPFHNARRISG